MQTGRREAGKKPGFRLFLHTLLIWLVEFTS